MLRDFRLVDVFASEPYRGNPVAVVLDGTALADRDMQRFAHWMNLSETTFVLPPRDTGADYRVRIFTPTQELPFAGHPTLGTCHAWLEAGHRPARDSVIVQECDAGLVQIRRTGDGLGFAAPPLVRYEPADEPLVARLAGVLGVRREAIEAAQWVDNGPGWVAVLLGSAQEVLALRPGPVDLDIGVAGPHPPGAGESFEVRAFFPKDGSTVEDPVTGSLNAALAHWLIQTGRASAPYTVRQGTALGRAGRVHVTTDSGGQIWVAGGTVTCVTGQASL